MFGILYFCEFFKNNTILKFFFVEIDSILHLPRLICVRPHNIGHTSKRLCSLLLSSEPAINIYRESRFVTKKYVFKDWLIDYLLYLA